MSVTAEPTGRLEDTYARAVPDLVVAWRAAAAPSPRVLVRNDALAVDLGIDPETLTADGILVGQVPDDVTPVAQVYSGHQFGMYQPRLGDGRALLLGELVDPGGRRHDVALKGSGRTPFARGGDGKAAVGPMLREYLMGEAMHALGIPTSRGLAVTATGEQVPREEGLLPGAVLTRIAASHLRVGTFQFAAANHDPAVVRALADHAIARHYPAVADSAEPYLDLYRCVVDAQASLVAQWMLVGFVHGVMNTDNTTISGETIDYGPCAFMDGFDPGTVFSSIDHAGRYAYGHQPKIVQWNLARFAETLIPLLDDSPERAVEKATDAVNSFADRYDHYWLDGLTAKLGLVEPDRELAHDLLGLLRAEKVDWTTFFRALPAGTARDLFLDRDGFDAWAARWSARRDPGARDSTTQPDRVNPLYIPRNHIVEESLAAATAGDMGPFEQLLAAVTRPYEWRPGLERYTEPGTGPHVTYCGT